MLGSRLSEHERKPGINVSALKLAAAGAALWAAFMVGKNAAGNGGTVVRKVRNMICRRKYGVDESDFED